MASQIAHIIYAKTLFDKIEKGKETNNLGKINKDGFFLGCVFPDMRRMEEGVTRKDTHLRFSKLDLDFSELTSFEAGWKFHLYCDMKREEILNNSGFYDIPDTCDLSNQPAKMLEDEILYDRYNNWEKLVHYFNNPPFIDSGLNIKKETFELWYAVVAKYLEKRPDDKSIRAFLVKQSSLVSRIDGIMEKISLIRKNKKALALLEKVHQEIV